MRFFLMRILANANFFQVPKVALDKNPLYICGVISDLPLAPIGFLPIDIYSVKKLIFLSNHHWKSTE